MMEKNFFIELECLKLEKDIKDIRFKKVKL